MNDTQPNTTDKAKPAGNGSKYLFMLILGLVLGAIATVMLLRALEARKDPFPESFMWVQEWHVGQLRKKVEQNRCSATDTLPHLKALRTTADNLETLFPGLKDDARFEKSASSLRASLDEALSSPPISCPGVAATADKIVESCKACHQDFD